VCVFNKMIGNLVSWEITFLRSLIPMTVSKSKARCLPTIRYPLLNRWKADPQLQSCISKLQQSLNIPFGFAVLLHRDAVVTITKFPVNSVAFA